MSKPQLQTIPLAEIRESTTNPNGRTHGAAFEDLVASVKVQGVLQPILVRPMKGKKPFELVAGHRRLAAAAAAQLAGIPALVRPLSDAEALEIQLVENRHRTDIHPLDEAAGLHALSRQPGYDVAKIASKLGVSVQYVYDRMKLLALTKDAQAAFRARRFEAGHAVLLARLKPADQARALNPEANAVYQHQEPALRLSGSGPGDDEDEEDDDVAGVAWNCKARTVRELQAWIDRYVRFDPKAEDVPQLFPATVTQLHKAKEQNVAVVAITQEYSVRPEARDGKERTYGPMSWRRADKKECDRSVTGVVVVGGGRGQAFAVCIDKTCKVHWEKESRERKRRAVAGESVGGAAKREDAVRKAKADRQQAFRDRFKRAQPKIFAAVVSHVDGMAIAKVGAAALADWRPAHGLPKDLLTRMNPKPNNPETVLRAILARELTTSLRNDYFAEETGAQLKKTVGFDMFAVMDKFAPARPEKPAKAARGKK